MNVPNIPEGQRPKATDVSPWNGVYSIDVGNMTTSNKYWIAGAMIFVFAVVLLSGSFSAYRHFSTRAAKYITYDHALRRVLRRAERDNLRRGLMVKEQGPLAERPQQIGEAPPLPQLAATSYRISLVQHSLIDPNRLVHNLSPVLNL